MNMMTISRKSAAILLISLFLLGQKYAMAAEWVSVGGYVYFGHIPVCALVLINGQSQFSCDGTGRYDMEVPVDANGMITVMVFADGFAPFNQIITPEQATEFPIDIQLDQNSPSFEVVTTYEPSTIDGRFIVSGTIHVGDFPVCALVLANGQNMFSCNENNGAFSLDVPLDQDGNITLMVFASGFQHYKLITEGNPDSDYDGVPDYFDEDDDNDGVFDEEDPCPLDPTLDCPIELSDMDTVIVDGKEWAQTDLFRGLTWTEINAVCPAGVCVQRGTLNGIDMTGWTWATTDDVNALFNFYIGSEQLGPGPDSFSDMDEDVTMLTGWRFFYIEEEPSLQVGAWHPMIRWSDSEVGTFGLTSTPYLSFVVVSFSYNESPATSIETGIAYQDDAPCNWACGLVKGLGQGVWFYRTP
jgi:hypothetical protein